MMAAVVSAPGKVMVAGGYVVLERPNPALVAAVSARVYSVVAPLADSTAGSPQKLPQHEAYIEIEVLSPQMSQSRRYVVTCAGDACALSRADDMAQNEYVEATLINSVGLVAHLKGAARLRPFSVSIHGDNAFYVMENEDGSKAENLPRFAPITHASSDKAQHAANVRKTGLGSSAALVTSMVGAILSHFQVISLPSTDTSQLRLVHNLSQFCHCCAQGKIGSGFDVAAAVYGSMQYVRFSPAILDVKAHDSLSAAQPSVIAALVLATSSQGAGHFFDHSIEAWSLPPQMHLVVGDVRGSGSSTPSMVSAINKWRKDQPQEASELWASIISLNIEVSKTMNELSSEAAAQPDAYSAALAAFIAQRTGGGGLDVTARFTDVEAQGAENLVPKLLQLLLHLASTMLSLRSGMRRMGEVAGVPLEPAPQTRLLDATAALPAVVGGGVPGAGGYDAVFAIAIGSEGVESVGRAWAGWEDSEGGQVSVMPLTIETTGIMAHKTLPD